MTQIVLTAEQSDLLNSAKGPVVLVNPEGVTVGQAASRKYAPSRFTPEEIAATEARIGREGPGIATAELLAKLRRLKP